MAPPPAPQIDWASQQSQWDTLVQAANTVVLQIQMILPRWNTF